MKCQLPEDRLLRDLQRRVIALEGQFGAYRQIVGVDTTPAQSITPVISITEVPVGDNLTFVIVFQSEPGAQYQAQASNDATTWANLDAPIPASATPAVTTSWTSGQYGLDDTPQYFRIRRFPTAFAPCPEA